MVLGRGDGGDHEDEAQSEGRHFPMLDRAQTIRSPPVMRQKQQTLETRGST